MFRRIVHTATLAAFVLGLAAATPLTAHAGAPAPSMPRLGAPNFSPIDTVVGAVKDKVNRTVETVKRTPGNIRNDVVDSDYGHSYAGRKTYVQMKTEQARIKRLATWKGFSSGVKNTVLHPMKAARGVVDRNGKRVRVAGDNAIWAAKQFDKRIIKPTIEGVKNGLSIMAEDTTKAANKAADGIAKGATRAVNAVLPLTKKAVKVVKVGAKKTTAVAKVGAKKTAAVAKKGAKKVKTAFKKLF